MKTLIQLFSISALTLSLIACGGDSSNDNNNGGDSSGKINLAGTWTMKTELSSCVNQYGEVDMTFNTLSDGAIGSVNSDTGTEVEQDEDTKACEVDTVPASSKIVSPPVLMPINQTDFKTFFLNLLGAQDSANSTQVTEFTATKIVLTTTNDGQIGKATLTKK